MYKTIYKTIDKTIYETIYKTIYKRIYETIDKTISETMYETIDKTMHKTMHETNHQTHLGPVETKTYAQCCPQVFVAQGNQQQPIHTAVFERRGVLAQVQHFRQPLRHVVGPPMRDHVVGWSGGGFFLQGFSIFGGFFGFSFYFFQPCLFFLGLFFVSFVHGILRCFQFQIQPSLFFSFFFVQLGLVQLLLQLNTSLNNSTTTKEQQQKNNKCQHSTHRHSSINGIAQQQTLRNLHLPN